MDEIAAAHAELRSLSLYKSVRSEEHAAAFIDSGMVRIGTLSDYRELYERDMELGDHLEGCLLHKAHIDKLLLRDEKDVTPEVEGALFPPRERPGAFLIEDSDIIVRRDYGDAFVFCMSTQAPSAEDLRKMGKGAVFQVTNRAGFRDALSVGLNRRHPVDMKRIAFGRCAYGPKETTESYPREGIPPVFLKDDRYAYQREVRLCWIPLRIPIQPQITRCGPLHAYCKRIA